MNNCSRWYRSQQGFAFITALAVMAILAIVLTGFIRLMIGDVVFASYQSATTRAFYLAESGVQEGLFRLRQGYIHPLLSGGFIRFPVTLSPTDSVEVRVLAHSFGRVIYEITASGTVKESSRRVRMLVRQEMLPAFSDAILGNRIQSQGSAEIRKGTLYSQLNIVLKRDLDPNQLVFAGGSIKKDPPIGAGPFYTHEEAVAAGKPNWYPGTRVALPRSEWESRSEVPVPCSTIRPYWDDLMCKQWDADGDGHKETYVVWEEWKKRYPNFFPYTFNDRNQNNRYDVGDPFTDMSTPPNGTYDPGEPYTDLDGNGSYTPPEPIIGISEDLARKAVIPPWPDLNPSEYWSVADITQVGGDPDNAVSRSNDPIYGPTHESSRPLIVLNNPQSPLNGSGHGVLLIMGDLQVEGQPKWYGTIFVAGTLRGGGNVTVFGGLIVRDIQLTGSITLYPGPMAPEYFSTLSEFQTKTWHENR
ncbi:MAG: hypothetical protein QN189_10575 [Armatimonadota bacterium]|nr:hypothetical protein [Armatimonadota bacterium]